MLNRLDEDDWHLLLARIREGLCTPFLGAGACYGSLPLAAEIARSWADEHHYPLEDREDLSRVAQYMAVRWDGLDPKMRICEAIRGASPPDYAVRDEPHAVMADLPLPVYLTTNYDSFMVDALRHRRRDPKQEYCRWNWYLRREPSIFQSQPEYEPTVANPIVFHLHGHIGLPQSLVLTEDDYLDFLVNLSRDQLRDRPVHEKPLPPRIEEAMAGSSLLFLGYRISDWSFRVIFRSIASYMNNSLKPRHVSVQLLPCREDAGEDQRQRVMSYLNRYFEGLDTRVYWGTAREFATELRQRWEVFNG